MPQWRNELKFEASEAELAVIRGRLEGVMMPDPHAGPDGIYSIRSLYFDDMKNSCAWENDAGTAERFKYRIRTYGNDPGLIRLEKKIKKNGLCRKVDCPLTREEYDLIAAGEPEAVLWGTESELLKRFCADILARGFAPKCLVEYERAAYVEPISNVRITLDMNISAAAPEYGLFSEDVLRYPLLPVGRHILEVKFDEVLPSYIRKAAGCGNLTQTAYSKYYNGRIALRREGR